MLSLAHGALRYVKLDGSVAHHSDFDHDKVVGAVQRS